MVGGLALVYRDDIDSRPLALSACTADFVRGPAPHHQVVRALSHHCEYKPTTESVAEHLLGGTTDLVARIYLKTANSLILCGDFNRLGSRVDSNIDELGIVLS